MSNKAKAVVTLWGLKGETRLATTSFLDKRLKYPCMYPSRKLARMGRGEGQKVVRVRVTVEEV